MVFVAFLGIALFIVVEFDKTEHRHLKARGSDVNDAEYGFMYVEVHPDQDISLPKGTSPLKLTELWTSYFVVGGTQSNFLHPTGLSW